MLTIQGIYDGRNIKPLEEIHVQPNVKVIITFLEDQREQQANLDATEKGAGRFSLNNLSYKKTRGILGKVGGNLSDDVISERRSYV